MNKQQYVRLSLVLAVPILIFSLWLSKQDSVFSSGQLVDCDLTNDYCYHERMPLERINLISNDPLYLTYNNFSLVANNYKSKNLLLLRNFNFPIKIYFKDINRDKDIDVTRLIPVEELENHSCSIYLLTNIECKKPFFSFASNYGRIEFTSLEDQDKFIKKISQAQSNFEDDTLIRISIGTGLFLLFFISYLIISWLIHFIIYGAKIKS